jgi:hypothetical protein
LSRSPNTTAELDDHFVAWRSACADRKGHFVADGNVGSDDEWWSAPIRVVLISKEPNDLRGTIPDLRKLFRNPVEDGDHKYRFQDNIGRWVYAVHTKKVRNSFPSFNEASERSNRQGALWQSAVVNLKKNAGGGLADFPQIRLAATRDRKMIVKQIDILDPQIVVFGRDKESTRLVETIVGDLVPYSKLCYSRGPQFWVRHWHPAQIGKNDRTLYNEWITTLGQLPAKAFQGSS